MAFYRIRRILQPPFLLYKRQGRVSHPPLRFLSLESRSSARFMDLSDNAFFSGSQEELGFPEHEQSRHESAGAEETDPHPQSQEQTHL